MASTCYPHTKRIDAWTAEPEKLRLIVDPQHPMFDPTVELEPDENLVLNIMAVGVIKPIVVRRDGDVFEVIDGRQRVKAAREANKRLGKEGKEEVTTLDIEVMMPDEKISHLKGIVKRTVKTPLTAVKNGMGVELFQKDELFLSFVRSYGEGQETEPAPEKEKSAPPEFQIIICSGCGVKNKVLASKLSLGPKCGKCGLSLFVNML